ncbi:hypothetical protein [Parabacteroides sp. FAFU027]|uniref:hypothetical protein n=1 Tax=Parabacteroides sp. FAFU027 TaxID=2922715 RepID=UPI001FAFEC1B|nr:hypothetical protein [Parabacteroides sp. FAFU027]
MNKMLFKKIYATIMTLALGSLCLAVSYKVHNENQVNLSDLAHFTGTLTNFYLTDKSSVVGGKVSINKKFVALEIAGLDQNIRVFRPSQNYSDFFQTVKKGDVVSIYFRKHSADYFNSDLYQVEINGENYLQIDEVKHNHSKASIATLLVGIFICSMSIYVWRNAGK